MPRRLTYVELLGNGISLKMVDLPGGTAKIGWIGTSDLDISTYAHTVSLLPFSISKYEVTQAQYRAVMGTNPSHFKSDDRPVENVSWEDAVAFCRRLSQVSGKAYRLPTEAEWEYACRAGNKSNYSFGDDVSQLEQYAWYSGNAEKQTHPVGQKKPNAFDLYDMHGNVLEWCADWYGTDYYMQTESDNPQGPASGSLRVCRGGSWDTFEGYQSYKRYNAAPSVRSNSLGFRIVVSTRTQ